MNTLRHSFTKNLPYWYRNYKPELYIGTWTISGGFVGAYMFAYNENMEDFDRNANDFDKTLRLSGSVMVGLFGGFITSLASPVLVPSYFIIKCLPKKSQE